MSRRAGAARAKAKKDDIAKAAAEVLNNINVASPPAVTRPAISGGLLHSTFEGGDLGTDVYLKHPQTSIDQERSPAPPSRRPLLHSSGRQSHPAAEEFAGIAQTGIRTQEVGNFDGTGGGSFTCDGIGVGPSNDGGTAGGHGVGADSLAPSGVPPIPPVTSLNQQPGKLTSRMIDVATDTAARASRLWNVVMQRVVHAVRIGYHWPAHSQVGDPQWVQEDGDATQRGNPSIATIGPIALLVLLFSSLVLGAVSYSLARSGSRVQASQQEEVDELREQLQDWREHTASNSGKFWEQLRGVQLEDQRLGLHLAELESKLETAMEEVQSLRRAIEAHNAVRSIVQGDVESGSGKRFDSDGFSEADGAGAAADGAALVVKGPDTGGLDLQGLPACHLRRLVAAAGPLLAARVTRHSPVIGEETALMRFHCAMSRIFSHGAGSWVHPIARHLTDPAATPVCLPLAVTRGADGSAAGSAFVELRLGTPAIVSAISFRYPAYGTWDTGSALLHLSAVVHEAPAASGIEPTLLKGGKAVVGGELMGGADGARSRRVELPPLQGLECQHVMIASTTASGVETPRDGGLGMLVNGITLHVNGNFGNPDYSCMPQVLVHGWAP